MPAEVSPLVHLVWLPFIVFLLVLAWGRAWSGGGRSNDS